MLATFLAVVSISVIIILCLFAVYYHNYHENWMQWLGLWGVVFAGTGQIAAIVARDGATASEAILYVAVAMYGIGTARKVQKYVRKRRTKAAGQE